MRGAGNPLLDRARAASRKRPRRDDEDLANRAEVALAYLRGELSGASLQEALGIRSVSTGVGSAIASAYQRGLVEIKIRRRG